MANNTSVMLIGRVGSDPVRRGNSQQGICTFRLASSRGYYDRNTRAWREQPSTWVTVKTYRTLAENVMRSVHKGEPVIVSGSLITESWTDRASGEMRAMNVIEAATVGHDLSRGTADFNRPETAEKGGGGTRGNVAETNGDGAVPATDAPDGEAAGTTAPAAHTAAAQSVGQPGGVNTDAQRAAATDAWGTTAPPAAAASGYAGEAAAGTGAGAPESTQGAPTSGATAAAAQQSQTSSEFDGDAGGGDAY